MFKSNQNKKFTMHYFPPTVHLCMCYDFSLFIYLDFNPGNIKYIYKKGV